MKQKRNVWILNGAFVIISVAIVAFLLNAPEETTSALPKDDNHLKLYDIKGKKEAEKFCGECHDIGKEAPLPEGHPPKYRCLFCHKRK